MVLGIIDVARSHGFTDTDKAAVEILNQNKSLITPGLIKFGEDILSEVKTISTESSVFKIFLSEHICILYLIKAVLGEYEPYDKIDALAKTFTSIDKAEDEQLDILKEAETYLSENSLVSLKIIYGIWNYYSYDERIRNGCIKIIDQVYAKHGRLPYNTYLPLTFPQNDFIQYSPLFECDAKKLNLSSEINNYNSLVYRLNFIALYMEDCIVEFCNSPFNFVNEVSVASMIKYVYIPACFVITDINKMKNKKDELTPFAYKQICKQPDASNFQDVVIDIQKLIAKNLGEAVLGQIIPAAFEILSYYFLPYHIQYCIDNFNMKRIPARKLDPNEFGEIDSTPEEEFTMQEIKSKDVVPFEEITNEFHQNFPDTITYGGFEEILLCYDKYIHSFNRKISYASIEFNKKSALKLVELIIIAENKFVKCVESLYLSLAAKFYTNYGSSYFYDWLAEFDDPRLKKRLKDIQTSFKKIIKENGKKAKEASDAKVAADNAICYEIHTYVVDKYFNTISPDIQLSILGIEFSAKFNKDSIVLSAPKYTITISIPNNKNVPYDPGIILINVQTPQISIKVYLSLKDEIMEKFPQHKEYMKKFSSDHLYDAPYYAMAPNPDSLNESGGSIISGKMDHLIFSHIINVFNNLERIIDRNHIEYLKEMQRRKEEEKRWRREMELRQLKDILGIR